MASISMNSEPITFINNTPIFELFEENVEDFYYSYILNKSKYSGFQGYFFSNLSKEQNYFCEIDSILKKSKELLESQDIYNFNIDNYLIEFHSYNASNYIEMPFGIHKDDGAAVNFNVYTILYYIKKDNDIIGGDLIIYNEEETEIIDTIKIDDNMIIILKGDIPHNVSQIKGSGLRQSILCQVERI